MKKILGFVKPNTLLAFALYCVTCYFLYLVQYVWFRGALRTGFIYALIYPPINMLSLFLTDDNRETKSEAPGKSKLLHNIFSVSISIIACGLALFLIIYKHSLIGYQILGVFIALGIIVLCVFARRLPKISVSSIITTVYASVLVVTAAYVFLLRPATVNAAQKSLANNGYQNISYITYYQEELSLRILFGEKLPNADSVADGLGAYLFSGDKDGKPFGILVDIASGTVILRDDVNENKILSNLLEMKND